MAQLPKAVIIGSDHAGYRLKTQVVAHLRQRGVEVTDVGTDSEDSVDYPDFVHPVATAVEQGEFAFGIVVCGSGQGASMTANKHAGIRCALSWTPEVAALARQHNDANVLSLAERTTDQATALAIVDAFFEADFEGGRHARRVAKIPCA